MNITKSSLNLPRWSRMALAALAALTLALATPRAADATLPIDITCSPSVVIMTAAASGDWMTVHTDLPYRTVALNTIALNGLPVSSTKSDSRGYLVAKFNLTALRLILTIPATTLTLSGTTREGVEFSGSDVVRVVE